MAGTGVGKFSSTAGSNTANMSVNFAENMAPSAVNNAARELMGHMRDMYEQLGDGYFEFGDGDGTYTVARGDADTITLTSSADISGIYFAGRKIRITDGGANVVEGTIASSSHSSTTQTVNLTGISLASGTPTKVELGIDTAAFGGRIILDDDGDTYIEAVTDDTIDIYVAGAKDFVITANTFTAESGSTIAAQALTATTVTASGEIDGGSLDISGAADIAGALVTHDDFTLTGAANNAVWDSSNNSLDFADSAQLRFGASADLKIFHDGSNSQIVDSGTGNLKIAAADIQIMNAASSELMIQGIEDGAVTLYHNNIAKLATTATGIDVTGTGTFTTADNTDTLTLTSTDTDASSGPNLRLYRNSHTGSHNPQDGDDLGRLEFEGQNDAGQDVVYGRIRTQLRDASDGTEDGKMDIGSILAGTTIDWLTFDPADTSGASVIFNQGSADIDFRVESNDNSDMLNINAGTNRVGIAGPADLGIGLHIREADSGASVANYADALVLEGAGDSGMTICSGAGSDGSINFADSGAADVARITYNHNSNHMHFNTNGAERLRISSGGKVAISEAAPDVSDGGLCINQGANDSAIITLKSSDIAHGMTGGVETDTYSAFQKYNVGEGGLGVSGFSESASPGINLFGAITTGDTGTSHADEAAVRVIGSLKDGTGFTNLANEDNLFTIMNNSNNQVIFKGDGEIFSNQTATVGTFDTYEDAQLVRAYELSAGRYSKGLIDSKFDKFVQYNAKDLADANLIGKEKDGTPNSFVNITGMQRLHNGAIWQQYEKTERLANAMYELAKAAVGEEKANKILEQNEIKLLN